MKRRVTIPAVVAVGLAYSLAACGDVRDPIAPRLVQRALHDRGGPPTPADAPLVLDPAGSAICGFPLYTSSAGKLKELDLPGGRIITVGPGFTVTYVNGLTGKSVTNTQTGPIQVNPLPDGGTEIVFVGRNAVGFDDPPPGEFPLELVSGRFSIAVGPDGALVRPFSGVGSRVDLCALLR